MLKRVKVLIIVCSILLLLAVFLGVWFFGASYKDFPAKDRFAIPGLDTDFMPQGICRVDHKGVWLVTGYMWKGGPSRVYVIDEISGEAKKYFTLTDTDGATKLTGHLGGIANSGNHIWISSERYVYHFYYESVSAIHDGGTINVVDKFDSGTGADFCYCNDEVLVVGEFYREQNYKVEGHELIRDDGETNYAYALAFKLGNGKYGLDIDSTGTVKPVIAYSLPNLVQGFCLTPDNKIVLSTSYALPKGEILVYDMNLPENVRSAGKITILDTEVNLIPLWTDKATQAVKCPNMCEGLDYYNGEIFVLYESAAHFYRTFTRTRNKYVQSFKISDLAE